MFEPVKEEDIEESQENLLIYRKIQLFIKKRS